MPLATRVSTWLPPILTASTAARSVRAEPLVVEHTLATCWESWEHCHWPGLIALLSALLVLLLGLLLVWMARHLHREHAEGQLLMQALAEGVYRVDPAGRCTFINPAALVMLGFSKSEVLGRDQHALFHYRREGQHYPLDQCPIHQTLRDGRYREMEETFIRKDGSTVLIYLKVNVLLQGTRRIGAVVIFRDLTLERQREEALRVETMRLRAIYDVLPVGIGITDPAGHLIDCNPASERILRLSREQLTARDYDGPEWDIRRPDGSPMPAEEYASVRALREQRPVYDTQMELRTPASSVWLSVNAIPVAHEQFGVVIAYTDITAERQAQQQLRASEEKYRALIDQSMDAIYLHDEQGRFLEANRRATLQTGYRREELLTMSVFDLDRAARPEDYTVLWQSLLAEDRAIRVESQHRRRDGSEFPIEVHVGRAAFFGDQPCLLGIVRDITERRQADQALRDTHRTLLAIMDHIDVAIYVADMDTHELLFVNRYLRELKGMRQERTCWRLLHPERAEPCADCTNQQLRDAQGSPSGVVRWERQTAEDGRWYDCRSLALPWFDGRVVRLGMATDITHRKQREHQLINQATIDGLTGLYRREYFMTALEVQLALLRSVTDQPSAVLLIDLDHFKSINDRHGHAAGDEVLRAFARLLETSLRQGDVAGRLGGEEFGALLREVSLETAMAIAERLRQHIATMAVEVAGQRIPVTASIGLATLKPGDPSPGAVLARADAALYDAKRQGRDRVVLAAGLE